LVGCRSRGVAAGVVEMEQPTNGRLYPLMDLVCGQGLLWSSALLMPLAYAMPLSAFRIQSIHFDATHVHLQLANGAQVGEFLTRNPRLEKASAKKRAQWVLTDDGLGANWPALWPASATGMVNVLDLLWDARYEGAMQRLHALDWKLDALSAQDQQLVALWRMEADINNGGFMQFLCNWGDPTCQLALQGLRAIGAVQTHAALAGMRGLLDRLEDDPAVTELSDLYEAMTPEEQDALEQFEEAYYARPEDLARLGLLHFGPEPCEGHAQ
jgi:hypothetical protein